MRDLEIIVDLVLLAFNFISKSSHHSLTLPRSRIRDSSTVTLTPGDGTIAIKVKALVIGIGITDRLILQNGKKLPSEHEVQ